MSQNDHRDSVTTVNRHKTQHGTAHGTRLGELRRAESRSPGLQARYAAQIAGTLASLASHWNGTVALPSVSLALTVIWVLPGQVLILAGVERTGPLPGGGPAVSHDEGGQAAGESVVRTERRGQDRRNPTNRPP